MKTRTGWIIGLTMLALAAYLILTSPEVRGGNPKSTQCTAITKAGARCKIMTTDSTGICHVHRYSQAHPKNKVPAGAKIYTGPRGGKFWLDSLGNKHYTK